MPCTTILVGKKASYDGSTMIARNDDSGSGHFTAKKFVVTHPEAQPRKYKSEISHVEIELPDNPMRYTSMPNALKGEGVWAASGVNEANVGMTATETITSNPRVLGADPLVNIEKGSLTSMIDDLSKKGYVYREKNLKDRRKYMIVITEEGKQIAADFTEKLSNDLEEKFFKLNTEDREKYLDAIETLETLLNKSELN